MTVAVLLTFAILTYISKADMIGKTIDIMVKNGVASPEEISYWVAKGTEVLRNVTNSIK